MNQHTLNQIVFNNIKKYIKISNNINIKEKIINELNINNNDFEELNTINDISISNIYNISLILNIPISNFFEVNDD